LLDGDEMMLEFVTEMEGITVNGVDIIRFNEDGKISDFKVMVRPLKAINKVWEMMARELEAAKA
ncbi:MAG: nuclear transport factor 2 family protein, partial [Erythrobacter sp.]